MIIGSVRHTIRGFRVYQSEDRRFFDCRPEGRSRREYALRKAQLKRAIGFYSHRHWRMAEKHLDGHHVAVRLWHEDFDGAA